MRYALTLLTALSASPMTPLYATGASEVEAELTAIKARLPFISLGEFLYRGQLPDHSANGEVSAVRKVLARLYSPKLTVADLKALSNHADPDIRALAMLGLVAKETPEVVPVCIRLMNDPATTIPAYVERNTRSPGDRQIYTQPQTIGDIARKILEMVNCPLRYHDRSLVSIKPDAATWWASRKDNPDWLSWYQFLYVRASQGSFPPPPDARADIQRFRKKIDALPPTTRSWTFLYLSGDVFLGSGRRENYFATEKEMIGAVQDLGAEALIEFLRSGIRLGLREPSLDEGRKGRRFIVTYAPHFFTVGNVGALMQLELFTAAADADPKVVRRAADAAMQLLTRDYQRQDRARAMAALASLGDDTDRGTAVKWFYDEPNKEGGSSPQGGFIRELKRRHPDQWRDVVRRIVAHPEFDQLRPIEVMYLARMVEKLGGEQLIGDGYRYEDDADTTRNELRKLFQIESTARKMLEQPEKFLKGPEWTTELGEMGQSLALSPDGKLLAIGMAESEQGIRVLCTENGTERRRLQLAGRRVNVVFTASDQKLICAPSYDGKSVLVWLDKQEETATHVLQTNGAIFPARTDERIAVIDSRSLAWLEFPSGTIVWKREYRNRAPYILAISPDAAWMATNDGWSKEIRLIDTTNGNQRFSLVGHASAPPQLSFSNDSSLLVSVAHDNRVFIWSVSDGKAVREFRGDNVRFGPVVFASDAKSFVAGAGYGALAAYAVSDGQPKFGIRYKGNWREAILSADGKYLYLMIDQTVSRGSRRNAWMSRIECWKLTGELHVVQQSFLCSQVHMCR